MKLKCAVIIVFLINITICNASFDVSDVYIKGDSTLMGMRIESSYFDNRAFLIETTGARFEYIKGKLKIYQGLDAKVRRLLSTITFANEPEFIRTESTDDHVLFWSKELNIGIYGDSTCIVSSKIKQQLKFKGNFKPDYEGRHGGELLLIDDLGGMEIYPQRYEAGYKIKRLELGKSDWIADYGLNAGERVMIAAFPGKTFDWEKSFKSHIVTTYGSMGLGIGNMYGQMPQAGVVKVWSQKFDIISFSYEGLYKKSDLEKKPYPGGPYIIANESEFKRLVAAAHKYDMKVIVYCSLFYFDQKYKDFESFYEQINELKNKFGMDGLYIDGLTVDYGNYKINNKIGNWEMVRRLRQLFGSDGVIVYHGTSLGSPVATVPNIDSYCDATLNGEGVPFNSVDDPYLKYQVKKYGISNTIGLWMKGKHPDSIIDTTIIDTEIRMNCREMWGSYVAVNEPPRGNKYTWNTNVDRSGWWYYSKKLNELKHRHYSNIEK